MKRKKITFSEMVDNGLDYLTQNTDITYFGEGSIARSLVEATALEISRLQNFVSSNFNNSFLSTANGISLDLFGEMLGIPRITERKAIIGADDRIVRFYVENGTLSSVLTAGGFQSIPEGTIVQTPDQNVRFQVTESPSFPVNSKQVFVSVLAEDFGEAYNLGANQLNIHSLNIPEIKVTNDFPINTGSEIESDSNYRFRLSKALTSRFGNNETSIRVAALSQPGVSDVRINEFARGAGTFDVLLIPRGNRVTEGVKQNALRAIENVTSFGVSARVREPEYLRVKLIISLRFDRKIGIGRQSSLKRSAETAILNYLGSISIGGELIVNRIRAVILDISKDIVDLTIQELCINGKPKVIRNFQLASDELIIPDNEAGNPIQIL